MKKCRSYKKKYQEDIDFAIGVFITDSEYLKKKFIDILIQSEMLGFPLSDILINESKELKESMNLIKKSMPRTKK